MRKIIASIAFMALLSSCASGPEPIELNKDKCASCKMNISDPAFAAELMTNKGRAYKFDDIHCLIDFAKSNADKSGKFYVSDYSSGSLIPVESAFFVKSEQIKSPMNGHVISYGKKEEADVAARKFDTQTLHWSDLKP